MPTIAPQTFTLQQQKPVDATNMLQAIEGRRRNERAKEAIGVRQGFLDLETTKTTNLMAEKAEEDAEKAIYTTALRKIISADTSIEEAQKVYSDAAGKLSSVTYNTSLKTAFADKNGITPETPGKRKLADGFWNQNIGEGSPYANAETDEERHKIMQDMRPAIRNMFFGVYGAPEGKLRWNRFIRQVAGKDPRETMKAVEDYRAVMQEMAGLRAEQETAEAGKAAGLLEDKADLDVKTFGRKEAIKAKSAAKTKEGLGEMTPREKQINTAQKEIVSLQEGLARLKDTGTTSEVLFMLLKDTPGYDPSKEVKGKEKGKYIKLVNDRMKTLGARIGRLRLEEKQESGEEPIQIHLGEDGIWSEGMGE